MRQQSHTHAGYGVPVDPSFYLWVAGKGTLSRCLRSCARRSNEGTSDSREVQTMYLQAGVLV